jgi:DNA repair protein RadA/Sms
LSKVKKIFACTTCGHVSPKWLGKCPACGEWNTLVEEVLQKETVQENRAKDWQDQAKRHSIDAVPQLLENVEVGAIHRLDCQDGELNRVLGGGLVPGSVILLGGQPGIGKSTLLLQIAVQLGHKVLYVSGEESNEQIKMRAQRLGKSQESCYLLSETNVSKMLTHAVELQPSLVIVDSIQTMASPHIESTPGSVSQVRECAGELQRFAKESNIPVFLIGHITKDGTLAGPKLLEHIVDVVLQFEGDQHYTYRILRTLKNRFGSTDELGIYEMQSGGLREVENPSELLLSQKDDLLSGSAVAATVEGMRPMLIEVQALVSKAVYGTPQRTSTGFDMRRMNMLLAVLEKRCGFPMGIHDVFVNLAGGLRMEDPALDLALVAAMISSLLDVAIPPQTAFAGEIGLSGEIRAVNRIEQRIQEAARLGFNEIYVSRYNLKGFDTKRYSSIRIRSIGKIEELYQQLFQ